MLIELLKKKKQNFRELEPYNLDRFEFKKEFLRGSEIIETNDENMSNEDLVDEFLREFLH